jgi:hypothetical protein
MMGNTKVIIDNWPKSNHFIQYIPIIIAIIALSISLYSVYITRKAFIAAHRPYVWASNYGVIDNIKKTIIPIPFRIACRVKNSPARIIRIEVKIINKYESVFVHTEENLIRFPDETSEWNFSIGKTDYEEIMNRSNEDKSQLLRIISIEYSSLDGSKRYHYELQQSFIPSENQWKDIQVNAN